MTYEPDTGRIIALHPELHDGNKILLGGPVDPKTFSALRLGKIVNWSMTAENSAGVRGGAYYVFARRFRPLDQDEYEETLVLRRVGDLPEN